MTTAVGPPLPKYQRVAAQIRRQIADGTLRPGQPAPSGAELSRAFGFSTLTCRKALRALIAEGLLVPGPSPNARPRVADPQAPDLERDLADAARALSVGLAGRRHAAGLTQAELAALAGVSVTTVGHAETGRTWQSRRFWERADSALRAAGDLLRLHDAFRAASSPHQSQRPTPDLIERTVRSTHTAHPPGTLPPPPAPPFPITPTQTTPAQTRSNQTASPHPGSLAPGSLAPGSLDPGSFHPGSLDPGSFHPGSLDPGSFHPGSLDPGSFHPGSLDPSSFHPGSAHAGSAHADSAHADSAQTASASIGSLQPGVPQGAFEEADIAEVGLRQVYAPRPDAAEAGPIQGGQVRVGPAPVGPTPIGPVPVGPSRIVIVWTDGSVTTVHAPEIIAAPPEATFPDLER
jgi:Bacterial regulatory proteins, gntR family/Helix-turn-helix domain